MAGTAPSGGADTITCTATSAGGTGGFAMSIAEFSNVQYFANDNVGFTRGTTANPATVTSNNLLTLVPNELIVGMCDGYDVATTSTIQSPFTGLGTVRASTLGENVVTTVTNYTMSCAEANNTTQVWQIVLAGFRPSGGSVVPPASKGFPIVASLLGRWPARYSTLW